MVEASTAPQVFQERRGRVAVLTLNRPERLNAWSQEMAGRLHDYIEECNDDSGVGAIVITGAGRGFCSGADLSGSRPANGARPVRRQGEGLPYFLQRSKPIIAAINGPAIGVGLTLTLCCDIRLASERARLSMRFVRIGLTPELASTYLLPQIVGIGFANELTLTGRIVDAEEAGRMGLVNRVVAHDNLVADAVALADEIAFNPSQQVKWAKQLIYSNAANDNMRSVLQAEDEVFGQAGRTESRAEAARAFMEKREPNFHQ
ncbi:MAG: enoyl-CoA hydratase/isomerase family protein [Tepidiformaceae bacterium]